MKRHAASLVLALFLVAGCSSGGRNHRDDGPYSTQPSTSFEQARHASYVKAEAERLQKANPSLSRADAYKKAEKDNPYIPSSTETQAQSDAQARAKKQAAEAKLVKELDKLKQ